MNNLEILCVIANNSLYIIDFSFVYNSNFEKYILCAVTHEDKRLAEDIFHRAYMAAWLLRLLKIGHYIPDNVKTIDSVESKLSNEELFIAELLLHNLQLLQFNSHEVRANVAI